MRLLEVGNLDGIVLMIFLIMVGPALLLWTLGLILTMAKKKTAAKVFYILGVVYVLVSLGICGIIIAS